MMLERIEKRSPGHQNLTTRFVRDWRMKSRADTGEKMWLRRSRLVAREYASDVRMDVRSPASGSQTLRLLPVIFLSMKKEAETGGDFPIIGSLDIKDAFLQVDQEVPTQVSTSSGHFAVLKNLPGQRIGAKAWFDHLTSWLEKEQGFEFSKENPCLGRCKDMASLIHVDDVMYVGKESFVQEEFLPKLRTQFEISEQRVKKVGDAFPFLRRTYELTTEGLRIYPGKYAEDMVDAYEKDLGRAKLQKLPCGQEILEPDETTPLGEHLAGLYRSLVGCGIYLASWKDGLPHGSKSEEVREVDWIFEDRWLGVQQMAYT